MESETSDAQPEQSDACASVTRQSEVTVESTASTD